MQWHTQTACPLQGLKASFMPGELGFDFPVGDGVALEVEVEADFHDWQTAERKARRIVLQINLIHCSLSRFVEFQLEQIERLA